MIRNLDAAARDAYVRGRLVALLEDRIDGSDNLDREERAEPRGRIREKPGLWRYLRVTPGGLLRIDKAKIAVETRLDGKTLLRTSELEVDAADIARGYKALAEVEYWFFRGWRDSNSSSCARSTTATTTGSSRTCSSPGSRCCSSAPPSSPAVTPGATSPTSSTASEVGRVGRWRGGRGSVSSAPPIEPCMRFSRTRLTDVVHRVAFGFSRQDLLGLSATMIHTQVQAAWHPP
jgi:hypothetical protein